MPAPLTRSLGRFAATLTYDDLPARAVEAVKLGFTDCAACMLAGANEPVVRIVGSTMVRPDRNGEAQILLGRSRANAADAALLNGVAAHALDYDDVALSGHPSVALVPAILAEAEAVGADGRAAIAAYVAGYETWAHLIAREPDPYHRKGWHPTAVLGPLAAAAAVASLRRLNETEATMAIAIAASLSSGLVANFGTMTKPFHAGRAAASGVTAARLAQAGMTASQDAVEHSVGLLAALSPNGHADREQPLDDLGRIWRISEFGLNVKKYPMCYGTHRALDAIMDLVSTHDLKPATVAGVTTTIGRTQAAMLRNHRPQTGLEAKFSMEFAMASVLVARRAGLRELTDDFVRRPDVQSAMEKVTLTFDDHMAADDPAFSEFDRVEVTLAGGGCLTSPEIRYARGHWALPLKDGELWSKFRECAANELGESATQIAFERLQTLERQSSLRDLGQAAARPAA